MVEGIIFNFVKVNTVPCMFTASLSRIASSLAYIESIIDTTNDIEQTVNSIKKCNLLSTNSYQLQHAFVL